MAEIEHFCDPAEKTHPKFESVQDTEMLLFSAANQMDGKSAELHSIGEAVDKVTEEPVVFQHHLTEKSCEMAHLSLNTFASMSEFGHLLVLCP
jgi:glycyl-tRNA synthetase (class II)